jgi:hypothetical protein
MGLWWSRREERRRVSRREAERILWRLLGLAEATASPIHHVAVRDLSPKVVGRGRWRNVWSRARPGRRRVRCGGRLFPHRRHDSHVRHSVRRIPAAPARPAGAPNSSCGGEERPNAGLDDPQELPLAEPAGAGAPQPLREDAPAAALSDHPPLAEVIGLACGGAWLSQPCHSGGASSGPEWSRSAEAAPLNIASTS